MALDAVIGELNLLSRIQYYNKALNCSLGRKKNKATFKSHFGPAKPLRRLKAVILAPDVGCVETSWKSAGGTDADTAIGNAGAQMLVKLLELERLLELDHVSALLSLSLASHYFRVSF
ncbi:hypothetical protein TNCV_2129061 [Trichonephila clavipes]|nr:hypothetical protein TNCV_2129061 [Trichonephila clavipes]